MGPVSPARYRRPRDDVSGGLIVHLEGTAASRTNDEDDACAGIDLRHQGGPARLHRLVGRLRLLRNRPTLIGRDIAGVQLRAVADQSPHRQLSARRCFEADAGFGVAWDIDERAAVRTRVWAFGQL